MAVKYRKEWQKTIKTLIYIIIGFLVIVCNSINLIYALVIDQGNPDTFRLIALISSFLVECLGILYCIVQDMIKFKRESSQQFVYENTGPIPFVDREELIQDILSNTAREIQNQNFYYTKNIRYRKHNGKKSLAKKLCYELQSLKDKKSDFITIFDPKLVDKMGNIILVDYANHADTFETHIKSDFTYIRGKINIVVVINAYEDLCLWTDDLKDKDVFFIFLNFNENSEDALFFADDKILDLLIRLQTMPAFTSIFANKTKEELSVIASKLGYLSNNNIGTIIDLLSTSEFEVLLETDKPFIDFYFSLKHGKYQSAQQLYKELPEPSSVNKELKYKMRYEHANLTHFLGEYDEAYNELEILFAEICNDSQFTTSALGSSLIFDIILLQAHVKKHQGDFLDAANILKNVQKDMQNLRWLRSSFSIDIFRLNELIQPSHEWEVLLCDLDSKMQMFKEQRKLENSDFYFFEAYYPIVQFYNSKYDKKIIPSLITTEDKAIAFYEKEERRYLTNCYFIKAELYRINQQWNEAEEYYTRCYNIYCHNGDKDILYLVAITCKHLQYFEDVELKIPFDWDKAIEECKQQEGYRFHQKLISQMELANVDPEISKYWVQHYRVTINPIP